MKIIITITKLNIITITKLNLKQKYDSNKNTEKMVAINEIHDK